MTDALGVIPSRPRFNAPRARKLRTDKPPQKQCVTREPQPAHLFEGADGLTWSCQGRGKAA